MAGNTKNPGKSALKNIIITIVILGILAGIPYFFITYQSRHSGISRKEIIKGILNRSKKTGQEPGSAQANTGRKIDFLNPKPVGQPFTEPPMISNLETADLDNDGLQDIVVCDARNNFVSWIRQYPAGVFTETVIAEGLIAPAHIQAYDFDKDGDKDLMVAVLGMLFPNNDKIGSVIILENDGKCNFTKHVVAEKIARVSDVRAGDLDNDGDNDLAVAQFGYDDGETRWIENLGGWKFRNHILQNLSGPINVEIVDIDKDGDNDIVSLVSQEWEEIYCFVNQGKGVFKPALLYKASNEDFGSSGIGIRDFDLDGDSDIIYTNGDAFDYIPPLPRPWHGVQYLENKGNLTFEYHRICDFPGAYSAKATDIDSDGDLDLFVVSGFNLWDRADAQSFIWLENDGTMKFTLHNIATSPTHLLVLDMGNFNGDKLIDMVTGGMHAYPPYDRMGRVTLWLNNGALNPKK